MTSYSWAGGSGDWNSADWTPSGTPGASTAATISTSGAYTVTVDSSDAATSLTISDASADLLIDNSGLLAIGSGGLSMSAGEIDVGSGGSVGGLTDGGAFNVTGGTLNINSGGTLTLSGTLDVAGGAFNLNSGGEISGGVFETSAGAINWAGGALSGVKVEGPLNLTSIAASVELENGATVVGASGSGAGTINATGSGAAIWLETAQTVADETINIGYSNASLNYIDLVVGGGDYAFASSTTIDVVGRSDFNYKAASITEVSNASISVSGGVFEITGFADWNYDDYFTNAGSITINSGGGFITEISNFTNSGSLTVSTGATATIDPTTFATSSTSAITIGASATMTVNAHNAWSNLGVITLGSGSNLILEDDSLSAASLGKIVNNGGAVDIAAGATYNNSSSTLNGASGPGVLTLDGGTISGGVATAAGLVLSTKGGVLSGVTVEGALTVGASGVLTLGSGTDFVGASGTGAGVLNVTGSSAILNLGTDVSVSDETINLGNSSGAVDFELNVAGSSYALASNATLDVAGSTNIDFDKVSNAYANQGVIDVTTGGLNIVGYASSGYTDNFTNSGALTLGSETSLYVLNLTNFNNSGALNATADDQVTISSTTFTDSGALTIGTDGTLVLDPTSLNVTSTGSIAVGTGAYAYVEPLNSWTNYASSTLTGGSYSVAASGYFEAFVTGTFTTLAASVTLSGSNSQFLAYNSSTGVSTSLDTSLRTISSSGSLSLLGGRGWTISGAAVVNQGVIALGGGTLAATASGASLSDVAGGKLSGYGTVTATSFANSGVIEANGGALTLTDAVTGAGALQIDANANLIVDGAIASGASANFNGANATLTLKSSSTFAATVGAFQVGDAIDLVGIMANSVKVSGNQLLVMNGSTTVATLNISAAAASSTYVTSAVSGGTDIVVSSSSPTTATVAQYLAAVSSYDALPGGIAISDTGANIGANIPSLNDSHIVSITASSGTPAVSLGVAAANKTTLAKIAGSYAISDTAANIQSGLGSLTDSKINSIIVSDNGVVTLTVAALSSDLAEVDMLVNASGGAYSVAISDSAADIENGVATLQANVARISSITSTSGAVSVGATTAAADEGALAKIVGGFTIVDTAANIAANFAAIASDGSVGALSVTSGSATLSAAASIAADMFGVSGSGSLVTIGANIIETGAFSLGAGAGLSISSGDRFTIDGAATLSGAFSGAGTLATSGGVTISGATVSVSNWTSTAEILTLDSALTYAGAFSAGSGDVIARSGGALTLSGATKFTGGVSVTGADALTLSGATTVSGALSIGGTGAVTLAKALTDSGGDFTLGDSSGDATALTITAKGTLDFTDDHNLLMGTSTSTSIKNTGLLEKTGGTATSTVSAKVVNNGKLEVTAGVFDMLNTVSGTGSDIISGASTMEFAGTVAATQTLSFSGANGALELLSPSKFSATISDFDMGGASGDSLILASPWKLSSFSENAAGTLGTMTIGHGTVTATLEFAGDYNSSLFKEVKNASGQMVITY